MACAGRIADVVNFSSTFSGHRLAGGAVYCYARAIVNGAPWVVRCMRAPVIRTRLLRVMTLSMSVAAVLLLTGS